MSPLDDHPRIPSVTAKSSYSRRSPSQTISRDTVQEVERCKNDTFSEKSAVDFKNGYCVIGVETQGILRHPIHS